MTPPKISIIVLAAGSSSRMGRPKQLLKWKGTTLLGHAIRTLKSVSSGEIVVVLGAHSDRIEAQVDLSDVRVILNPEWEDGLGSSIRSGIEFLGDPQSGLEAVLIVLADQPLIDSGHLNTIINIYIEKRLGIVASAYDKGRVGVPVLFDKTFFKALMEMDGDRGAQSLISKHPDQLAVIGATHLVADIDTPEDYHKLYREHH